MICHEQIAVLIWEELTTLRLYHISSPSQLITELNLWCFYSVPKKSIMAMQDVNPFAMGHTLSCGWQFEHAKDITVHVVSRKHFLKIF